MHIMSNPHLRMKPAIDAFLDSELCENLPKKFLPIWCQYGGAWFRFDLQKKFHENRFKIFQNLLNFKFYLQFFEFERPISFVLGTFAVQARRPPPDCHEDIDCIDLRLDRTGPRRILIFSEMIRRFGHKQEKSKEASEKAAKTPWKKVETTIRKPLHPPHWRAVSNPTY